jgi:prepilin-type N-terminal cleavage/methylation domain-containing protein
MKTEKRIRELADKRNDRELRNPKLFPGVIARAFASPLRDRRASRAFSLIELLVVIGVIVILAAMTFPAINAVKRAQAIHRAQAELSLIESAIEAYHTKLGFYPPDNPLIPTPGTTNWCINQLYYELLGTTKNDNGIFQTLDGSAQIAATQFKAAFSASTKVAGFMNCSRPGAGDDTPNAVKFLSGLRPAQFLPVTMAGSTPVKCTVLGVSMGGPPVFTFTGPTGEIVPYGYNSSNPQHNPKSFDLWVDIVVGDKTNRISNWSAKPIIVYYPSIANSYP